VLVENGHSGDTVASPDGRKIDEIRAGSCVQWGYWGGGRGGGAERFEGRGGVGPVGGAGTGQQQRQGGCRHDPA
jgi:hypothetical protein